MTVKFPQLLLSLGLCLGVGLVGSIFTSPAISTWYSTLNKPFFTPPNWVFAPAWTLLYIMMGVSLYLVWISKSKLKKDAINIFFAQLGLNVFWSIIFFGLRNPILALVDIIALWIAVFLTIRSFYKVNKLSGNLLIPYILWITFATVLNLSIVILNPSW